jgi:hypothetical protein
MMNHTDGWMNSGTRMWAALAVLVVCLRCLIPRRLDFTLDLELA